MQEYVDRLLAQLDGQTRIADRVFRSPAQVMSAFAKQVLEKILMEYAIDVIDRTRQGGEVEVYLKAVIGTYHQCRRLVVYINKPKDATSDFRKGLSQHLDTLFESQVEPYLRVESDYYRKCCDTVVDSWKKKVLSRYWRINLI